MKTKYWLVTAHFPQETKEYRCAAEPSESEHRPSVRLRLLGEDDCSISLFNVPIEAIKIEEELDLQNQQSPIAEAIYALCEFYLSDVRAKYSIAENDEARLLNAFNCILKELWVSKRFGLGKALIGDSAFSLPPTQEEAKGAFKLALAIPRLIRKQEEEPNSLICRRNILAAISDETILSSNLLETASDYTVWWGAEEKVSQLKEANNSLRLLSKFLLSVKEAQHLAKKISEAQDLSVVESEANVAADELQTKLHSTITKLPNEVNEALKILSALVTKEFQSYDCTEIDRSRYNHEVTSFLAEELELLNRGPSIDSSTAT